MEAGDGEVVRLHLLHEPVDLTSGIKEHDALRDREHVVQVEKSIKLPLFALYIDIELRDPFECQCVLLDQNLDRVTHELLRDLQHIF